MKQEALFKAHNGPLLIGRMSVFYMRHSSSGRYTT